MTYEARETSIFEGAPVELYEFNFGAAVYRYTSAELDIVFNSETFLAHIIERSALRAQQDDINDVLEIEVPLNSQISNLFPDGAPLQLVKLTRYRKHRDDAGFVLDFIGHIGGSRSREGVKKIIARNIGSQLATPVPHIRVTRLCTNVLYDSLCQVDRDTFKLSSTVSAIAGATITVTGLDAWAAGDTNKAVGGVLRTGGVVIGFIQAQSGDDITLFDAVSTSILDVSDAVEVLPGCDRSIAVCLSRFDNVDKFNGHHKMPTRNVFSGTGFRIPGQGS